MARIPKLGSTLACNRDVAGQKVMSSVDRPWRPLTLHAGLEPAGHERLEAPGLQNLTLTKLGGGAAHLERNLSGRRKSGEPHWRHLVRAIRAQACSAGVQSPANRCRRFMCILNAAWPTASPIGLCLAVRRTGTRRRHSLPATAVSATGGALHRAAARFYVDTQVQALACALLDPNMRVARAAQPRSATVPAAYASFAVCFSLRGLQTTNIRGADDAQAGTAVLISLYGHVLNPHADQK
jgi:hypothetical protein